MKPTPLERRSAARSRAWSSASSGSSPMKVIDLNCDMGESYGAWRMGDDRGIMPLISSANIACGYQAGAVAAFARAAGSRLHHLKIHGALYNMAARDPALAEAIARATRDLDGVILYALSGSAMMDAARALGVHAVGEVFADRSYQSDGTLTPRGQPGAMITDETASVAQALMMVQEGKLRSQQGDEVAVDAGTLCLHGDQPGAVRFARALRQAL